MKTCNKCQIPLNEDNFRKKGNGLRSVCKECENKLRIPKNKFASFSDEDIREYLKDVIGNKSKWISIKNSHNIQDIILKMTPHLIGVKIMERIYCIINNLQTPPMCKECHKNVIWKDHLREYWDFCSHNCKKAFNKKERNTNHALYKEIWYDENRNRLKDKYLLVRDTKEYRDKRNAYHKEYYKLHPEINSYRSVLSNFLANVNEHKTDRTHVMLKYSLQDFEKHIESMFKSGMTWSNWGKWEVDHIIPIRAFKLGTPASVVNALSNLQPLWKIDNLLKRETDAIKFPHNNVI